MIVGCRWPDGGVATKELVTFDGGSRAEVSVQQPDRYGFFHAEDQAASCIPRGAGLSFAAGSFGSDSVSLDLCRFDRILDFDSAAGVVEVEAGVTLAVLFHFLEARGFYLPVQPGYPAISVGGCIAADVHGKNAARDGTFINQVRSVCLFHPSHGLTEVSPEKANDLFRATCGGFGLTGVIVTARLKAERLPASAVQSTLYFASGVPEAADKLAQLLPEHDFAFGWHDLSSTGARFGRGWITASRFVDAAVPRPRSYIDNGMTPEGRLRFRLPLLNRFTSGMINAGYGLSLAYIAPKPLNVFQAVFPFHGKEAYFSLFGRAGFHETQVIIPRERFADYVDAVRAAAIQTKAAICFTALKLFAGSGDLIRFDGTGVSFALHLPRSAASARFLEAVDRATVELGGRPNAIKDSRLPRAVFEATYPERDRFRSIINDWDPKRLFRSALTTRLGL
jgi:decaprenylphospho-beta-D-ribofuranose 2-oxidase